jgi:hypothetical protein
MFDDSRHGEGHNAGWPSSLVCAGIQGDDNAVARKFHEKESWFHEQ